jgi:hypothetical protein
LAGKPAFHPEKISIAGQLSFYQKLFSFPKPSITGQKKTPKQKKSTKPEKTKPKLQILSSKIKSKQQILNQNQTGTANPNHWHRINPNHWPAMGNHLWPYFLRNSA